MRLWPFGEKPEKPEPTVAEAARVLAARRKRHDRALIRARARKMRAEMGLPEDPRLRDR